MQEGRCHPTLKEEGKSVVQGKVGTEVVCSVGNATHQEVNQHEAEGPPGT